MRCRLFFPGYSFSRGYLKFLPRRNFRRSRSQYLFSESSQELCPSRQRFNVHCRTLVSTFASLKVNDPENPECTNDACVYGTNSSRRQIARGSRDRGKVFTGKLWMSQVTGEGAAAAAIVRSR